MGMGIASPSWWLSQSSAAGGWAHDIYSFLHLSCCCGVCPEGMRRKETALAAMQAELEALQVTATRMLELEAELKASNTHLLTMNDEVERARAASKRIE